MALKSKNPAARDFRPVKTLGRAAHPTGMIAGNIGTELEITPSTLSHHLERLKREEVVTVRRDGTCLWYTANAQTLEGLLQFLFAECCQRNCCVSPDRLTARRGA